MTLGVRQHPGGKIFASRRPLEVRSSTKGTRSIAGDFRLSNVAADDFRQAPLAHLHDVRFAR